MKTLRVISYIFISAFLLSGIYSAFEGDTSSAKSVSAGDSQSQQLRSTGRR